MIPLSAEPVQSDAPLPRQPRRVVLPIPPTDLNPGEGKTVSIEVTERFVATNWYTTPGIVLVHRIAARDKAPVVDSPLGVVIDQAFNGRFGQSVVMILEPGDVIELSVANHGVWKCALEGFVSGSAC